MARDPGLRGMMAALLAQQKEAERDRDRAVADGKLWLRRVQLAMSRGDVELAGAARDKALEARDRHTDALKRLQEVDVRKSALRREARGEGEPAPEVVRAQATIEAFRAMGIHPEFEALRRSGGAVPPSPEDEAEAFLHEAPVASASATVDVGGVGASGPRVEWTSPVLPEPGTSTPASSSSIAGSPSVGGAVPTASAAQLDDASEGEAARRAEVDAALARLKARLSGES